MSMNRYIADELANKVYHLYHSLNDAQKMILELEIENKILKDALHMDSNDKQENNLIATT